MSLSSNDDPLTAPLSPPAPQGGGDRLVHTEEIGVDASWGHIDDPASVTVRRGGVTDYRLWIAIAVTVSLNALVVAVSSWAAHRNRQYTMDRLYPPVEV